jgi:hypothetical protein
LARWASNTRIQVTIRVKSEHDQNIPPRSLTLLAISGEVAQPLESRALIPVIATRSRPSRVAAVRLRCLWRRLPLRRSSRGRRASALPGGGERMRRPMILIDGARIKTAAAAVSQRDGVLEVAITP